MHPHALTPPEERRSGDDRRRGVEWRSGVDRRSAPRRSQPPAVHTPGAEVERENSVIDRVTGLYTQCYFDAALVREIARCLRYGADLSIVMLDAGEVETVAATIQNSLRRVDVAARHGLDEIAILLPDTDANAARVVAERVCARVGEGTYGGVAQFPLNAPSTSDAQLLKAAGKAVRLAKIRGIAGDCVAEGVVDGGRSPE